MFSWPKQPLSSAFLVVSLKVINKNNDDLIHKEREYYYP